jgi:hypothetical protein
VSHIRYTAHRRVSLECVTARPDPELPIPSSLSAGCKPPKSPGAGSELRARGSAATLTRTGRDVVDPRALPPHRNGGGRLRGRPRRRRPVGLGAAAMRQATGVEAEPSAALARPTTEGEALSPRIRPQPEPEWREPPDVVAADAARERAYRRSLAMTRKADPYAPGGPWSYFQDRLTVERARQRRDGNKPRLGGSAAALSRRDRYLGMQPVVAGGDSTSFPSTISALTDDAPHMQGAWSRLAPVACADLKASTPASAAITRQTLTRRRRPQNLTGPRMPSQESERHGPCGSSSTSASPIAVRPSGPPALPGTLRLAQRAHGRVVARRDLVLNAHRIAPCGHGLGTGPKQADGKRPAKPRKGRRAGLGAAGPGRVGL